MGIEKIQSSAISVIVPAFNAAAYLQRCLDAVVGSNYPSYECIVVNDGSTDGYQTIAARYPVEVLNLHDGPFGPAYARNRGAKVARGRIFFFIDADVVLAPGALQLVAEVFKEQREIAAVFGSYDACPNARGIVSQYRNLLHHFVHQNGNSEASTFWAGCGAIRRSVFEEIGGFDEKRFRQPSIEDIELGYRLRQSGYRILLDKRIQGTHLKQWNLSSLVRTDITCRAMPWSRLIFESKKLPNDLNLKLGQRMSFLLVAMACLFLVLAVVWPGFTALSVAALLGVVFINRQLYAFFFRQRGIFFAAACVPLHFLYYLYSGLSYFYVWAEFQIRKLATSRPISALKAVAQSLKS